MPKRIAQSTLNASTLDILNVIRQNATYDYQQNVPVVTTENDIPRVGEVIYGTPAFANQFINALVNRIAMVMVTSATFNNPYSILKKGYIEFGESIEEIFVGLAKAVHYTPEKGAEREFKRTLPDVRSAFHTINWRVMYPITIQDEDLRMAFLSAEGVSNLITKVIEQVYTAAEYDEFLLFKYLMIKAISGGLVKPIGLGSTMTDAAESFRGISNILPFMKSEYNEASVKNNTPKANQVIFMDAMYNAKFDVEVLAGAFNMEKADFMGRLFLIDDWTTFDNERFDQIRAQSDGLEEVTSDELALLADVKAVIVDERWFQVYDNLNRMTEKYVASGLYWNYFYHVWKTISHSPFANAVAFVTSANTTAPTTITGKIASKDVSDNATVLVVEIDDAVGFNPRNVIFDQSQGATTLGIAVQKFGAYIIPSDVEATVTVHASVGNTHYSSSAPISAASEVGTVVTLTKNA